MSPSRTMHRTARLAPLFWMILLLGVGCGPVVLIPGGALDGPSAPAPPDWAFAESIDTIQLETRPTDPYSVNIWAVGIGADLYVHAGANRANWVENMEADPDVRARVGGSIYALRATRVTDQAEFDRFEVAYANKYGSNPRNSNVEEAYLFRLTAR